MTPVNPTLTPATTQTATARPEPEPVDGEKSGALTADFNTFLTLLTTQMKNQDPLQPIESTEFVAQLAQFSTVEQQVQTNDKLAALMEVMSNSSASALADWLGSTVRAVAPVVFSGSPVAAYPAAPPKDADKATLVVRDANGGTVAEVPFKPGDESVTWNGKTASGVDAVAGTYSFSARYADKAGATTAGDVETYNRVVEARRIDGEAILSLESGAKVKADLVTGVR
jgi:flagellar basal-body rod modification protein FlgD